MLKRAADILIAAVLVVLTLPVVLFAAIGSAIALRAWPFFVQRRVGWDGMSFRFVKIRTLPTSTPKYMLKDELHLEEVPRFTRALRVLHFDELPQLFLVLTGRMSLVGPRPEMIEFHDLLEPGFAASGAPSDPAAPGSGRSGGGAPGSWGSRPSTTASTSATSACASTSGSCGGPASSCSACGASCPSTTCPPGRRTTTPTPTR